MPEITLTVDGLAAAGTYADTADWTAGFDHAALVTAHRSRADGKDLYVRHTTYGICQTVAVSGANTAACKVGFNLPALVAVPDSGYRLVFGNLARAVPVYYAAGGAAAVTVAAGSTPAPSLPTPGYDLTEVVGYGVRESPGLSPRRSTLHENAQQRLRAQWRACSGETAHEVRAVVETAKGAAAISYAGYSYTYVPGSLEFEMQSADYFNVAVELELATL